MDASCEVRATLSIEVDIQPETSQQEEDGGSTSSFSKWQTVQSTLTKARETGAAVETFKLVYEHATFAGERKQSITPRIRDAIFTKLVGGFDMLHDDEVSLGPRTMMRRTSTEPQESKYSRLDKGLMFKSSKDWGYLAWLVMATSHAIYAASLSIPILLLPLNDPKFGVLSNGTYYFVYNGVTAVFLALASHHRLLKLIYPPSDCYDILAHHCGKCPTVVIAMLICYLWATLVFSCIGAMWAQRMVHSYGLLYGAAFVLFVVDN
eukprot:COSAG01_NODE_19579_length_1002_cov_1.629014_1_plen_263_part_10